MATYEQVTYSSPDGAQVGGSSSEPIAFFGATPTTRPTAAGQAAPASTAPVSVSATQWGYSTSTQALAITDCLIAVRAALVTLGLINGS